MLIAKIVSGGQTGVDRGAIEAALESGFPYCGLIPKGRLAEDGIVPLKFDQMEEAPNKNYIFRTEWNVVHSDATLIISPYVAGPRESKRRGVQAITYRFVSDLIQAANSMDEEKRDWR